MPVCKVPGCVALGVGQLPFCAVHLQYTRREAGDAPIHCYACKGLIRIGRRWIVRAEGAYHVRLECLTKPSGELAISIRHVAPAEPAHEREAVSE